LLLTPLQIRHGILVPLLLSDIAIAIIVVIGGRVGDGARIAIGIGVGPILEIPRGAMLTDIVCVLRVGLESDLGAAQGAFLNTSIVSFVRRLRKSGDKLTM
jgi:hypothetical protein